MKLPIIMTLAIGMVVGISGHLAGVLGGSQASAMATEVEAPADLGREAKGWQLIADGALLVDVRTPAEYSAGHLEGAINIPHDQVSARLAEFGDDKDRSIVVYCRSGRRSGLAEAILEENGFNAVFNTGGYEPMLSAKPAAD